MIAYLIENLNVRGGTHKQLLKLLEYTEAQGSDFIIITKVVDFDKTYPEFKRYESRVKIFNEDTSRSFNPLSRIKRLKRNTRMLNELLNGVNVANIHDCGFDNYLSAFKDIPTVWQINDINSQFRVGIAAKSKDSLKKWISRKIFLSRLKHIDKITVNVTKNANRIKEKFSRDAEVLYCGIEPMNIEHNLSASLGRFKDKSINLLSSGVWFPYRNYETQVDAVRLLVDKGYDVKLNIIGSTNLSLDYKAKIEKRIHQRCLTDRINICGMVDEEKFRLLHKDADIFLFINIDQSWGLAVFEAMSCGIPVIVSESVGATEILHNNIDSIFVNPLSVHEVTDKIIALATDEKLYARISSTASEFHKNYSWDKAYSSKMYDILINIAK